MEYGLCRCCFRSLLVLVVIQSILVLVLCYRRFVWPSTYAIVRELVVLPKEIKGSNKIALSPDNPSCPFCKIEIDMSRRLYAQSSLSSIRALLLLRSFLFETLAQVFVQSRSCMFNNLTPSTEELNSWIWLTGVVFNGGHCREKVEAIIGDAVIIHQYPFRIVLADKSVSESISQYYPKRILMNNYSVTNDGVYLLTTVSTVKPDARQPYSTVQSFCAWSEIVEHTRAGLNKDLCERFKQEGSQQQRSSNGTQQW